MKIKQLEEEFFFFGRSRSQATINSSSVSSKARFLSVISILWSIMLVLPTLPATANASTTTTTNLPMTTTTVPTTSTTFPTTSTTFPTTSTTFPTTTTIPTTPESITTTTPVLETTTTIPERTTATTTSTTTTTTTPAPTTTTTATQFTTTTNPVPTTTATTSNVPEPIIISFYPNFGPIAGLTKVALTGTGFDRIEEISFGASGPGNIDINSRTEVSLTVLTPESNFTGFVNPNIVLIGGGRGKRLNQQFLYKGNPNIVGFNYSKYQLITGGSLLTVLGTNLDSVANPMISATVTISDRVKTLSNESYLENCRYNDSGAMHCPLPDLRLPEGFIQKLESEREATTAALTATPAPGSVAKLMGPNGTYADIYLGFVLDGLRKYENISDPKAEIPNPPSLSFVLPPIINSSTDVVIFNGNEDTISITGKYFQLGCLDSGVQCKVYIGGETCSSVTVVSDNQITCVPPKNRPKANSNDSVCTDAHANTYAIKIVVGFRVYQYKCLEYFSTNIPLIVGLTVGLGVPVCILLCALVVCLCLRCRREKKTRRSDRHSHGHPLSSSTGIELSEQYDNEVDSRDYIHSIEGSGSVYPPSSEGGYTSEIGGFRSGDESQHGYDNVVKASALRSTYYPPPRIDELASGDSSTTMGSQGKGHPPGWSSSYGHSGSLSLRTSSSSRSSLRGRPESPDSDFLRRISEHSES